MSVRPLLCDRCRQVLGSNSTCATCKLAPPPPPGCPLLVDRRTRQEPSRSGRRRSDTYWTVPQISADLGISERSLWRKILSNDGAPEHLPYSDFGGFIRIDAADYTAWKRRCSPREAEGA